MAEKPQTPTVDETPAEATIAADMVAEQPPPSPFADQLHIPGLEPTPAPPPEIDPDDVDDVDDDDGEEEFDPAIHAVDDDGNPVRNKDGTLRKKCGRKPANAPIPASEAEQYRQSATVLVDTLIAAGRMLGGDEWKPETVTDSSGQVVIDERGNLIDAWATYLESQKVQKMPPWATVLLVTSQYVGNRISRPTTRGRIATLIGWARTKWIGWRQSQ